MLQQVITESIIAELRAARIPVEVLTPETNCPKKHGWGWGLKSDAIMSVRFPCGLNSKV